MEEPKKVCGSVTIKDNRVLTLFKKKYSQYEFPGGKTDPGETLEEATIRETLEETGCKVILGERMAKYRFTTPSGLKEVHLYRASIDGEPRIMEPDKFNEIFWMPIADYNLYKTAPYVKMFCEHFLKGLI